MTDPDPTRLSPGEFLRSQRLPLLVCSALFTAVMLAAVFSVDPAYNYPRLITDQLLYYMKAISFVADGNTTAQTAINAKPFIYAATPGLLRAPFIAAFSEFDDQLRAIQVSNIALAIILGGMSAYIVSWVLPRRLHWIGVCFSFATLLLNPVWVTNILSPLADLPYAVASLGGLIVLNRMALGAEADRRSLALKILFAFLFIVAFGCRYTAPVLFLYGWVLFRQQRAGRGIDGASVRYVLLGVGLLALLVAMDIHTIVSGYLWQPFQFLINSNKSGIVLNTLAVAVPSQIIPGLILLYREPPASLYRPVFGTNPADMVLVVAGLLITALVVYGMWRGRRSFKAEILYVAMPLPLIASMIPSTARYLLSYQPLIWLFLYLGISHLALSSVPSRRWLTGLTTAGVVFCCVAAGAVLYIRSSRITGSAKVTISSFSLGESRRHAPEVATTYRSLRDFLESRPRERSLVLGDRATTGQWKVIAGIDYYEPDSALAKIARARDLYMVMSCQSAVQCSGFDGAVKRREDRILDYGAFEFDNVFATRNDYSAAIVYRVRVAN